MSAIAERPIVFIFLVVIMIICLLIIAGLTGQLGSSGIIGPLIANILFSVPFGSISNTMTQPTAVIPA